MNFIKLTSNEQVISAYHLMKQLVPSLTNADDFLAIVRRKERYGYELIAIEDSGEIRCLAGYRFNEYYAIGKYLFLDDLVTDEAYRSKGYGGKLFAEIIKIASQTECSEIHLDTSISLEKAHKFYYNKGMKITQYHLTIAVRK